MELYVKVDDGLYLNAVTGQTETQPKKSIPLIAPISVRKAIPGMRPQLKYIKKIGDVWIGSNKMSFALLLAYLQLKNDKSSVIGMFKREDHYLYIEGSVDAYKHASIVSGFTSDKETPDLFITVRGKVYDGIFGPVDIKNTDFDFLKAYRDLSRKITPIQIGVLVLCLAVSGYVTSIVMEKPPRIEVPKVVRKAPPPPPPLTAEESGKLRMLLKDKFIEKYGDVGSEISRSAGQKWLKSLTLTTSGSHDRQMLSANFVYSSFYPFSGAKREGNAYVWTLPYGESLSRADLKEFSSSPVSPYVCLKYLLNYTVMERTGDNWTLSIKESKYPRITFLLNLIYDCPCAVKEMTMDEKGLSATVVLEGKETI